MSGNSSHRVRPRICSRGPHRGSVYIKVMPTPVEENVDIGHTLKDGLDAPVGLPQFLLRPLALRDVARDHFNGW